MRYSNGAASLLSTVFAFQASSVVVAQDIFDPIARNGIDAGILAAAADTTASGADVTPSSWIAPAVVSTCAEFVECAGGFLADGSGTTCFEACDNGAACCYGNTACVGFTGKVCKDGSCSGYQACTGAKIPTVVNSCIGKNACREAGQYDGAITQIIDSCKNGYGACTYICARYGSIGSITGSCTGDYACYEMATQFGKVGNLFNSCKGARSCINVGQEFGIVGSITGSCNYSDGCGYLGAFGGKVVDVINSCTNTFACFKGAFSGGNVASITNSCTEVNSCFGLGRGDGNVGYVKDSCTEPYSCLDTGFNRGSIGSISTSCKALDACKRAGSGLTGSIKSNLNGCCNDAGICESATQATLPAQCKRSKVRTCVFAQFQNWNGYCIIIPFVAHSSPTS
jgi:hypothetical protein